MNDVMQKIVIGTRGSQLSLIQTNIIKDLLQPHIPNTSIEIKVIKTTGDKNMSPIPLDSIGKGWFTKEIDKQLLEEKIENPDEVIAQIAAVTEDDVESVGKEFFTEQTLNFALIGNFPDGQKLESLLKL